jgi:hypothetical protein
MANVALPIIKARYFSTVSVGSIFIYLLLTTPYT